ncbi:MAG: hypothetical protein FGF51_04285 [Candidatus Brockarchaeota archaeon]|nr:hypothetical protein [Candidatus Brockarchaeota archaeon]
MMKPFIDLGRAGNNPGWKKDKPSRGGIVRIRVPFQLYNESENLTYRSRMLLHGLRELSKLSDSTVLGPCEHR